MNDDSTMQSDGAARSVAPTLQLSRLGLIFSLLAMVMAGLGVYALFPESVGGPPLPVEVELDEQPVVTTGNRGVVVTKIVRIRNLADHEIAKLSVEINGQYLMFQNSPLQVGEVLELPQRVFTDKRSSQRFNPSKYEVNEIVVTGQLPSNARGVSKFDFE